VASLVDISEDARLSWQVFLDYQAAREEWAKMAAVHEDFFYGVQWQASEITALQERGMAPLVVNRTMPVIQQEMAMFMAKRPAFKYFPVDDVGDPAVAAVFNDAAQHVWHISNGDSEYQQTMQDYFVMGAGYIIAYIDPHADDGRGEVMIKSLPPWDVYPDPNSRNIDLSDARYIIVSRLIDIDQLIYMYPDHAEQINDAPTDNGTVIDKPVGMPNTDISSAIAAVNFQGTIRQQKKVRFIERYEKIRVKRWKIFDATRGVTFKMSELPKAYQAALHNDLSSIRATPVWETAVEVVCSLGDTIVIDKYVLKLDTYPVVPFYLHHRRNPYPVGDVAIIMGMQQETNKRRSIMLHNATLSGNFRMIAPKGSIQNKEEFERRGTTPGFLIEYLEIGGAPPRELLPAPLSPAWVQLEGEAKSDIEYSLSVFGHMMGSGQDAPETYRSLLALEERGQQKIQYKAKHARHGLRMLGIVVMQLIQMTYSPQKILRVVGETNEAAKRVVANGQEVDQFTGEIKTFNDLMVGKYDLIVADGTSMPTNRMAMSSMMMDMFQMGLVDKEEVWRKLDGIDLEAMKKRMSEASQLAAQLQQLQDALKNVEGLNQTLRRQLQQAEIHLGAQKEIGKMRDDSAQTVVDQEVTRARINDELGLVQERVAMVEDDARAKSNQLVQKTRDEMALMRMRAEMEAEVERERSVLERRGSSSK
jgi:hypothetical protein